MGQEQLEFGSDASGIEWQKKELLWLDGVLAQVETCLGTSLSHFGEAFLGAMPFRWQMDSVINAVGSITDQLVSQKERIQGIGLSHLDKVIHHIAGQETTGLMLHAEMNQACLMQNKEPMEGKDFFKTLLEKLVWLTKRLRSILMVDEAPKVFEDETMMRQDFLAFSGPLIAAARKRGIAFELVVGDGFWETMIPDPSKMGDYTLDLIENALRHGSFEGKSRKIVLDLHVVDDQLFIVVTNPGRIDPDRIQQIKGQQRVVSETGGYFLSEILQGDKGYLHIENLPSAAVGQDTVLVCLQQTLPFECLSPGPQRKVENPNDFGWILDPHLEGQKTFVLA